MTIKNKIKKGALPLRISLAIIGVIGVIYVVGGFYYQTHFFPGTKVNGTSVGQKTIAGANDLLTKDASLPILTIKENGKDIQSFTKTDLGVTPDYTSFLETLKKQQNPWGYPVAFFTATKDQKTPGLSEKELSTYAESLQKELDKNNEAKTAPQDAKLVLKDGKVEVTPEVPGDKIDVQKAVDAFKKILTTNEGTQTLELTDYTLLPKVTKDDKNLKSQANLMDNIASLNITYIINGNRIPIPKETLNSWVIFDGENVTLDQNQVIAFVTELGNQYNTSSIPLTFASTKRGKVEVPAGTLGWTIQTNEEAAALSQQILKGESFERVPITLGAGEVKGERIGKTYIEVDLTNQHMWYYKDGKVALETDIVSGKPHQATPKGVFYVWNKEKNATLRGFNDDGTKYASPVDFWMPIDWEGVGIHDSNWQPTYGGDWWVQNGSHGCINTPPAVMKQLFEMVNVDTPVIVF